MLCTVVFLLLSAEQANKDVPGRNPRYRFSDFENNMKKGPSYLT